MKNILFIDIDGTQVLPFVQELSKYKFKIHGFYHSKFSYGYNSRFISCKIKSPKYEEESNYISFLKEYILNNNIDIVIPLSDISASLISKYKKELLILTKYLSPDFDSFIKGYDKNELMNICKQYNFPHPRTISLPSKLSHFDIIDNSIFPALIKPNITCGGRGMTLVNNISELIQKYENIYNDYGSCHLQEYVKAGGKQIKVQLFLDKNNELINYSVIRKYRWYPEKGGSSACCESIEDINIVKKCYELLKKINWVGFADFDLIEDPKDGVYKFMELNPRIPACIKVSFVSGINWANIIIANTLNDNNIKICKHNPKIMRHIGFEILWFWYSSSRFKTKPNWFCFFSKKICFQDLSWKDPLPFIMGTIGNIKKITNSKFCKEKKGLR